MNENRNFIFADDISNGYTQIISQYNKKYFTCIPKPINPVSSINHVSSINLNLLTISSESVHFGTLI